MKIVVCSDGACVDEDFNGKCDVCTHDISITPCEGTCVDKVGATDTLFKCRVYYGDEGNYIDFEKDYESSKDKGMRTLNFGIGAGSTGADREGMSYCIDDLQIYQKTKEIVDLTGVEDSGSKVNTLAETVIDVQEGPGNKSTEDIINEALCMKVGVESALVRNEKQSIANYCTPAIVDGKVMVPLTLILDFIGYPNYVHGESYDITTGTSATYITIGRNTATVDGTRVDLSVAPGYLKNEKGEQVPVIAVDDIPALFPGWLLTYDDMGLIIIYAGDSSAESGALINRDDDLDLMLTIMKKFVFDIVTEDENGEAFDEIEDAYIANGEKVIADVKNNTSLAHPFIYTNQANFDKLGAAYASGTDARLLGQLQTLVTKADDIYSEYASLDAATGVYVGILEGKKPVNVYSDSDPSVPDTTDGYSPAGTLEAIVTYTEMLVDLAFAYQITGEDKYALLAYDISLALGEWTHWGPSYAINCATATGNFAVAYDWLYNFYVAEFGQEGVDALANILYTKGVVHGYNSSIGLACEYPRSAGDSSIYATLTNNWNAACSSGMIVGAMALIGYDAYEEKAAYLIGNNIQNLIANGLDQYAPDGSYAESALLWADGTNGFVKLIMALESAAGTTYGFEDTWGLDRTFYFACYIEDSDGKIWNYHEGGADGFITGEILGIDTQMFNYAGKFLNDNVLIAIRKNQIEKGKAVTLFDVLFYPDDTSAADTELALDYHMQGVHAFVSRSDWEDGALYTGIMGGANDVYGGQIDSGNFIYRNKGVTWFMDLGSDDQEAYSYFGNYRYRHYRNNAEGQNVVCFTSAQGTLPYGQDKAGNGKITKTFVNEHGSFAILDNSSAYSSLVSYANRGILVTNDRKTVVIQDEISFKKTQEVAWIAHTAVDIQLDSSKKIAYLTCVGEDGVPYVLRATLISKVDYKFSIMDCAPGKILDTTFKDKDYASNEGNPAYSRNGIQRLVIESNPVLVFNVAVVFELVDTIDSEMPVGYEWVNMINWNPVAEGTQLSDDTATRGNAVKSDIRGGTTMIGTIRDTLEEAYTTGIGQYYYQLTLVNYTLKTFKPDSPDFDTNLIDVYADYMDYYDEYEDYVADENDKVADLCDFAKKISGIK